MRKELHNLLIEDYTLHLVVGEEIPDNAPDEFHTVKLYIRDKDNNLNLYANISLPYLINHSEFLNIKEEPRYFFKEGYDSETEICRYICEIKPLGTMKGVYRILNGQSIKISSIEPLCELISSEVNIEEQPKQFMNSFMEKLNNNQFVKDTCSQVGEEFNLTHDTIENELKKYNQLLDSGILDCATKDCKICQNMSCRVEQNGKHVDDCLGYFNHRNDNDEKGKQLVKFFERK